MATTAGPEPDAVSVDGLLDGRLSLRQPVVGYRAALDGVLLAAALPAQRPGAAVLEAGCGAGAALLCLAWRQPDAVVTGLEIQAELAALARQNVAANGLAERVRVVVGDLAAPPAELGAGYQAAIANPPFASPAASASPEPSRARAVQEGDLDLAGWIAALAGRVVRKGRVAVIQRADRLDSALAAAERAGLGEVAVLPLWPRAGAAAKRVIFTGRTGVRGGARLCPGLTLHGADGAYTAEAEAILRDGASLPDTAWGL